jgi:hypothetical protein
MKFIYIIVIITISASSSINKALMNSKTHEYLFSLKGGFVVKDLDSTVQYQSNAAILVQKSKASNAILFRISHSGDQAKNQPPEDEETIDASIVFESLQDILDNKSGQKSESYLRVEFNDILSVTPDIHQIFLTYKKGDTIYYISFAYERGEPQILAKAFVSYIRISIYKETANTSLLISEAKRLDVSFSGVCSLRQQYREQVWESLGFICSKKFREEKAIEISQLESFLDSLGTANKYESTKAAKFKADKGEKAEKSNNTAKKSKAKVDKDDKDDKANKKYESVKSAKVQADASLKKIIDSGKTKDKKNELITNINHLYKKLSGVKEFKGYSLDYLKNYYKEKLYQHYLESKDKFAKDFPKHDDLYKKLMAYEDKNKQILNEVKMLVHPALLPLEDMRDAEEKMFTDIISINGQLLESLDEISKTLKLEKSDNDDLEFLRIEYDNIKGHQILLNKK